MSLLFIVISLALHVMSLYAGSNLRQPLYGELLFDSDSLHNYCYNKYEYNIDTIQTCLKQLNLKHQILSWLNYTVS